ncbi:hypothetical protein FJZ26_05020 [Candidatus Parvarchaeota archaeon]|nr:hypothetical protein [Candidatus Parvarchaeota archaeon]
MDEAFSSIVAYARQSGDAAKNCLAGSYQSFRKLLLESAPTSLEAQKLLLFLCENLAPCAITQDAQKALFSSPKASTEISVAVDPSLLSDNKPLREAAFNSLVEIYSKRKELALDNNEEYLFRWKATFEAFISLYPELAIAAVEKRDDAIVNRVLDYLVFNNPHPENKEKFRGFADFVYEKALSQDKYYYDIASRLFGYEYPKSKSKLYKLFELAKNEQDFVFTRLIVHSLYNPDWEFTKKFLEKINDMYENGSHENLRGAAKIVGYIFAYGIARNYRPPDMGFFEKIDAALYFLQSSGIAKRIFGSVDAVLDAASGKPPAGSLVSLLTQDDKAKTFALQCISYSFKSYDSDDSYSHTEPLYIDKFVLPELGKLSSSDIRKVKEALSDSTKHPETKKGALHMLHLIELLGK